MNPASFAGFSNSARKKFSAALHSFRKAARSISLKIGGVDRARYAFNRKSSRRIATREKRRRSTRAQTVTTLRDRARGASNSRHACRMRKIAAVDRSDGTTAQPGCASDSINSLARKRESILLVEGVTHASQNDVSSDRIGLRGQLRRERNRRWRKSGCHLDECH
jgi:hypothetical protein